MKNKLILNGLMVFTIGSFFTTSFSKETIKTKSESYSETISSKNKNGESWFKVVYYGIGVNTKRIPSLAHLIDLQENLTVSQREDYIKEANHLIKEISKENPDFFINFNNAMNSKDPIEIRNVLLKAEPIIDSALDEILNKIGLSIDEIAQNNNSGIAYSYAKTNLFPSFSSKIVIYNPVITICYILPQSTLHNSKLKMDLLSSEIATLY
jgi:SdpC family antimicrobial peptide